MSSPIQKAVIPIAGYGTRLFPATKAVPKALFPIVAQDGIAKPIIQLIIEEALTAGGSVRGNWRTVAFRNSGRAGRLRTRHLLCKGFRRWRTCHDPAW